MRSWKLTCPAAYVDLRAYAGRAAVTARDAGAEGARRGAACCTRRSARPSSAPACRGSAPARRGPPRDSPPRRRGGEGRVAAARVASTDGRDREAFQVASRVDRARVALRAGAVRTGRTAEVGAWAPAPGR